MRIMWYGTEFSKYLHGKFIVNLHIDFLIKFFKNSTQNEIERLVMQVDPQVLEKFN